MNRWTSVLLAFGGLIAFPLVDSAIKGTLILVLAAVACFWLRRDSAATRHFVWTIAIGLLVAMPVLSLVLPQWRILPGWMNSQPVTFQQISLPKPVNEATLVEANAADEPAQPIAFENLPADISGDASDASIVPVPMTDSSPSDAVSVIGPVKEAATTLPAWISVTWLIGCVLLLVRLSIAAMMLRRSERCCVHLNGERQGVSPPCRTPADGKLPQLDGSGQNPRLASRASKYEDAREPRRADALPLAVAREESQRLMAALAQSKIALGLKRPVMMLLDPKRSIPIVWGLWKTRLQLPMEALQWSDEQLQSVLLHELAHVRRRDLFVLALTQIACALHWFNPIVWIAAWRLHVERERACDDLVLNTGIRASSYAEHLLNVAMRLTSSQWTQACGLAMARSSSLHGRLSAVLSEKQNRRSVTVVMAISTLLCGLLFGIPMAMLRGADEVVQEPPASQTTEEAKPDAAPDEAPQPIVNSIGSYGSYRPAAIMPRIPRTAPTNHRDSTRPLLERLSDDPDQRAKELVYLLRGYRIWIRSDEWAEATRELVKLGDVALPYLIAELDRTDRDQTLRAVAFALRAINNPRAVPALIRAVPKALRPPGSDCGVYVRTKELHEFMSAIDHSPGADDDVSLGRPVTEIFSALGHLTSHKFGDDDELSSVFLEDPADEAKLRKQFADRQRAWETWWSTHGPELIPAAELPRWNQASAETIDAAGRDDIERAGVARFGELFPTGPDVRLGPVRELDLAWPGFADAVCAIDFNEHRGVRRFELYDGGGRHFQTVHSGADLSASEIVKEYDLCLWHSTNEQWSSIDRDIPKGQRIAIVREAHQRTLRAATGQQTYVFLTREGGQGIVQIDELDQSSYTRKIRYRMWNDTDVVASVGLPKSDSPAKVSWSAVHEARLAAPGPQSLSAWSLNNHLAVALPNSTPKDFFELGRFSEFYSSPEFSNWMVDNEVSLIFVWADYTHNRRNLTEDYLKRIRHLPAIQVMNCRRAMLISTDGFDTLSAADAAEFPDGLLSSSMSSDYVPGSHESGTTSTDAAVFHLTDGTVGMFEITNRHAADGAIEFRYKTVVDAKKADGRRVDKDSDIHSPELQTLAGDTVVAKVNGKPITVDHVLGGGRQIIDADSRLGENEREIVLRMAIQKRLRKRVDDELVMQELERKIPKEKRDSIRKTIEPQFDEFLAGIKKDNGFKTDDELAVKLAAEGNTISSLRELFMRSQMIDGYLSSLTQVPEMFTPEELLKHYEQHQDNFAVRRKSDSDSSEVARIVQPFDEVQKNVELHLHSERVNEGRAKALEEIRSRSTVEVFVELEEVPPNPDEPRASLDPIENPSRRTITWEDLAINATTLADIRDEQMALDEVSEDLKALNGKRIVLRGYMYPTFEATGLKEFVLVSNLDAASFVRQASIDALVAVQLHDKNVTDFVETREISVEGILRIDPRLERGQERSQLVQLYRLEDSQILQLHERTSVLKKGILVHPVSAEKPLDAALEYRAAFEHGDYDLGRGRTLRIRAIDRQQQSMAIEWPSDDRSQVYSWSMTPEAPYRADIRMSPEKPWGQTTGWAWCGTQTLIPSGLLTELNERSSTLRSPLSSQ